MQWFNTKMPQFDTWIKSYDFDPQNGLNYPSQQKMEAFNRNIIDQVFQNFHQKLKLKKLQNSIAQMPQFHVNMFNPNKIQLLYLKEHLTVLVLQYILEQKSKGIENDHIVVPKKIGLPLIALSDYLGIKYGMGAFFCFNLILNDPEIPLHERQEFSINDFKLRWSFTGNQLQERIFFGSSTVGSFYLFKIHRQLFEINKLINIHPEREEQIMGKMDKIKVYIDKMRDTLNVIFQKLDREFFFREIRDHANGMKNIKFEGRQQRVFSQGGSGGADPLFQAMERALGLKYSRMIQGFQMSFRKGMTRSHVRFISDLQCKEEFSYFREYFSLSNSLACSYNKVINNYSQFMRSHSLLIRNFIVNKDSSIKTGKNDQPLDELMKKFEIIKAQQIMVLI